MDIYGWGIPTIATGIFWLVGAYLYRRARTRARDEPLPPDEHERLRTRLTDYTKDHAYRRLIRSKSGPSELEFIQADWRYGLRRERFFLALGVVTIVAGVVLVLLS